MKNTVTKVLLVSLAITSVASISAHASPKPKVKVNNSAVLTVIHAIPAGFGADKVDVYSNDALVVNDATPGATKSFTLEPGTQRVAIYADGVVPSSTTSSLLSFRPIYLSHGTNVSFVAHLNANEQPVLTLFKNKNTEPGKKREWLTVRHVAAAPAVDVKSNSLVLFRALMSGMERKRALPLGSYPVNVVLSGTSTSALPSTNVVIKDGKNLIVYVWGSASKNNLQYFTQEVDTK